MVRQANAGVVRARATPASARARTPFVSSSTPTTGWPPARSRAMRGAARAPSRGAASPTAITRFFGDWQGELRFPPTTRCGCWTATSSAHRAGAAEVFADTGGFDAAFELYEDWELWLARSPAAGTASASTP